MHAAAFAEDRAYAQYFRDVSRVQIPANAEVERELFRRYHLEGDLTARTKLVEGGLRFVVKTAKQYHRGDLEFLKTLIAAGNVGLMVAVDRYRPWVIECPRCGKKNYVAITKHQRCSDCHRALRSRDAERYTTRFLTYAAWWITEAIRTKLYGIPRVYIPPYKQKEQHRAKRDETNTQRDFVYVSLDHASENLQPAYEADEYYCHRNVRSVLHTALRNMTDRYAFVLIAYFGLREPPKTLGEIATKLGVCPERVRQIKVDALEDLRKRLLRQSIYRTNDLMN